MLGWVGFGTSLLTLDSVRFRLEKFRFNPPLICVLLTTHALPNFQVAECHVDMGDFHNAVTVLTEVAGMAEQYGGRPVESVYSDFMAR